MGRQMDILHACTLHNIMCLRVGVLNHGTGITGQEQFHSFAHSTSFYVNGFDTTCSAKCEIIESDDRYRKKPHLSNSVLLHRLQNNFHFHTLGGLHKG